ncbi:hypothetical protein SODALDRAFT_353116 [Sodiomyces alkalinus F11]|uniref:FluG domain-containing protein n=1 Tax=Sodiomyces alkalinus (strain CBS 110278 / VKM F-3762 / F11) TaxID=1314773 RepID=A0A3N2PLK6_SODAK|nr:hypothetical protein SODALDRAFT_353116 [Sodiomyces alkalinus F11]ROT35415.1 hypothetical protein SODALDRAFT_353116 [Sodiomyces alkalinus F11]
MPYDAGANGALDNHVDFLAQIAQESQGKRQKRPAPLSAEEHAENRKRLERATFVKPVYADETQINVAGLLKKWQRYCRENNVGDWEATLKTLRRATIMDFFLFVRSNYTIKSWGTSHVYIRQFQQLYTSVTGRFLDRNDAKEVYKYHRQVLIPRFDLRAPNIDGKPVVSAPDLQVLLAFNIAYDTKIFPSERHRIQLACCYKMMSYTGARPAELVHNERAKPKNKVFKTLFGSKIVSLDATDHGKIEDEAGDDTDDESKTDDAAAECRRLDELLSSETKGRGRPKALCYEDIRLMIVRHPVTGKAIPAMAIKFVHHKGSDNKPKPTIFYFTPTKKLVFCLVSDIIALALHDRAFDAPSLTSAGRVLGTKISASMSCIPLRWKKSMLKIPILRRFGCNGVLSHDEPMPYAKLRDDMGQQSEDAGFEIRWTPRFCRRGAANAANVRHISRCDLNQMVDFDMQNTFLQEETETRLYKLFAHVSLTRDPRAKRDMVPAKVWANLPPEPEIEKLHERRAALKRGQYRIQGRAEEQEIRMLTEQIRLNRKSMRTTLRSDTETRGELEEEEYEEPQIELDIPERARLAEIWCHQPEHWTDNEIARHRIEQIDQMVLLCDKRETRRRGRQRRQLNLSTKRDSPSISPAPEADPFPLLMDAGQCPDCIGDGRLSKEERTFRFCRPAIRNEHFDDQHLKARELAQRRGEAIRCEHPKCVDVKLHSLDHFRNHVRTVHNVAL